MDSPYFNGTFIRYKNSVLRKRIKLIQLADIIINDMNIKRNDILMVHISLRNIDLIDAKPEDFIYLLKMIVGTGGTLLMPTYSENQNKVKDLELPSDLQNAFSHYHLINELFSQMPDTIQTLLPVGSFAAWGSIAKSISEECSSKENGKNKNDLFGKLCRLKAKIIGIGTPLSDVSLDLSDLIKYKTQDEISEFLGEDKFKAFKKKGIPFFWINTGKI